MTPNTKNTTQVLLLAMAVTGLVLASFIPMAIAHDPGNKGVPDQDNPHALSRTFPDLTHGERTATCDATEPGKVKEECDQKNPGFLFGVHTGVGSSYYYDELRIRVKENTCGHETTTDPTGTVKVSVRCGTSITQATLLGVGSPNDWFAFPGEVEWLMNTCDVKKVDFKKKNPAPGWSPVGGNQTLPGPPDSADVIKCDDWGQSYNATKFLTGFNEGSVTTGFWRPTIEEVMNLSHVDQDTEEKGKPHNTSYLVSCVNIDRLREVGPLGPKSPDHDQTNSDMDSHDWFLVLTASDMDQWSTAIAGNTVYKLSGSDAQAETQRDAGQPVGCPFDGQPVKSPK